MVVSENDEWFQDEQLGLRSLSSVGWPFYGDADIGLKSAGWTQ